MYQNIQRTGSDYFCLLLCWLQNILSAEQSYPLFRQRVVAAPLEDELSCKSIDMVFLSPVNRLAVPVSDPRVKRSGPTVVEAAHVVKHSM